MYKYEEILELIKTSKKVSGENRSVLTHNIFSKKLSPNDMPKKLSLVNHIIGCIKKAHLDKLNCNITLNDKFLEFIVFETEDNITICHLDCKDLKEYLKILNDVNNL